MIIVSVVKHETWPPMYKSSPRLKSHTVDWISNILLSGVCKFFSTRLAENSVLFVRTEFQRKAGARWRSNTAVTVTIYSRVCCFLNISSHCCWPHTKLPAGHCSWRGPAGGMADKYVSWLDGRRCDAVVGFTPGQEKSCCQGGIKVYHRASTW